MINKFLELITGKDDVERMGCKSVDLLNEYLKTRRLLIPKRPRRFMDPNDLTEETLLDLIEKDAEELNKDAFYPWILEIDGKKRLPAFSSAKKATLFSARISQQLNKVFALCLEEILLHDLIKQIQVDFVDVNSLSKRCWEISVTRGRREGDQ